MDRNTLPAARHDCVWIYTHWGEQALYADLIRCSNMGVMVINVSGVLSAGYFSNAFLSFCSGLWYFQRFMGVQKVKHALNNIFQYQGVYSIKVKSIKK